MWEEADPEEAGEEVVALLLWRRGPSGPRAVMIHVANGAGSSGDYSWHGAPSAFQPLLRLLAHQVCRARNPAHACWNSTGRSASSAHTPGLPERRLGSLPSFLPGGAVLNLLDEAAVGLFSECRLRSNTVQGFPAPCAFHRGTALWQGGPGRRCVELQDRACLVLLCPTQD